jgi:triosephosphate isomerase
MNLSIAESVKLAASYVKLQCKKGNEVWFAPSYLGAAVILQDGELRSACRSAGVKIGVQNVHWSLVGGAFTGEVSPKEVLEIGCDFAIIGHSERRTLFGENDESVNKRLKGAIEGGLIGILCVGETLSERESGATNRVLTQQLRGALLDITDLSKVIIAYEPVWAIGTGKSATPQEVSDAHTFIKDEVKGLTAESVRVLYGGSVKASNFSEIAALPEVSGALIGGASLKIEEMAELAKV